MHGRTLLRNAVGAALAGATTGTVYMEQVNRLDNSSLPGIVVYMAGDVVQADQRVQGQPYDMEREQSISVELHAAGATGLIVSGLIDDMDEEVEQLLSGDVDLNNLLELIEIEGSSMEYSAEQDRIVGLRTVTYIATWRHPFGAPGSPEG